MALSLSTAVEESQQPQPAILRADHISRNNMEEQLYSLRWHDFQSSILSSFRHLRDEEDFVDVTLACDGKSFTAHKMVLSACSPYFRHLLKANPCQHPIVILRDVKHRDMEALLRFMYNGEVSVSNEQLPSVLHTARMLQVKGLADVSSKNYSKRISEYSNETPSSRESSAERPVAPPRKRPRSRSRSRSYVEEEEIEGPLVEATYGETENGEREDKFEKIDKKIILDVNRESLLSQALEGRSQSLMAHLLATRSSQSETSSGHGINLANVEDDASDSDDTEASDRDRTDVGELSNTEDNYPSSGMASDRPLPPEIIPPSGFPHHPLLNLQSLHSLFPSSGPPSLGVGLHNSNNDLAQATRRSLDLMRIRATDPRPCPQCGKIYRSAHTLRTHLEDKHTVCPGYRCVLCGTVAKSRNSLHSHMSRQHRGISTKDLPVVPMPAPFDPVLASCLLAKAGVKVSPAELAARASPTSGNPRGRTADLRLDFKSPNSGSVSQATIPQVTIGGLQSHRNNPVPLIPLEDPEDLSLAQQRLRERERDKDRSGGSSGVAISPYGPAGLVSRLGLSSKMGKSWLESNMAAIQPNPPVAPGGGSTGSALLDTYLQLIAEHSSNMAAAAAAAAAAAQNASASNNNNSETNNGGDLQESLLDGTLNDKRSPKATAGD